MRILVAEDDPVTRWLLKISLERWQYKAVLVTDGAKALEILLSEDAPSLAILDRILPSVECIESAANCANVGRDPIPVPCYKPRSCAAKIC